MFTSALLGLLFRYSSEVTLHKVADFKVLVTSFA